jgi:uncharacterized RDD family membrane protein YckC
LRARPRACSVMGRVRPPSYVGLVTRAIAFAVDAAIVNVVALTVAAVVGLTLSVIRVPDEVKTVVIAAGAGAYALWVLGYFVVFWSTTGQTPGDRLLGFRVRASAEDKPIPVRRAVVRFAGLLLAALPLMAGFLLVLFDDRRRGLHDMLAGTVVIEAAGEPAPSA